VITSPDLTQFNSAQLTSSVTTATDALWSLNWPVELSWVESSRAM